MLIWQLLRWLGSLRLSSRLSSPFLSPLGPACLSLAPGYSQPSSPVNTFSLVISNWIETLCQYFRTCHVIKWDSLSQQMSNFSTLINEMRYNQMKRFGLFVGEVLSISFSDMASPLIYILILWLFLILWEINSWYPIVRNNLESHFNPRNWFWQCEVCWLL